MIYKSTFIMKKFVITFCLLIFAIGTFAQKNLKEEHLKFMGIPLCGDIQSFSKKLVERSNAVPFGFSNGLYSFKGTFAGYNADIHVCFNNKNREVYRAYSVIDNKERERAIDIFNEFKTLLRKKYPDSYTKDSQAYGFDSFSLWPKIDRSVKKFDKDNVYGKIYLVIQYNEQLRVYGVFLVYEESTAEVMREESKLADF